MIDKKIIIHIEGQINKNIDLANATIISEQEPEFDCNYFEWLQVNYLNLEEIIKLQKIIQQSIKKLETIEIYSFKSQHYYLPTQIEFDILDKNYKKITNLLFLFCNLWRLFNDTLQISLINENENTYKFLENSIIKNLYELLLTLKTENNHSIKINFKRNSFKI